MGQSECKRNPPLWERKTEGGGIGFSYGRYVLCRFLLGGIVSRLNDGCDRTGKVRIWDSLEGLGFTDGSTDRDTVVDVKVGEGTARGDEVVESAVGVGEVHDVLGDIGDMVSVIAGFVLNGADIGNDARKVLAGRDGIGAWDNGGGLGKFCFTESLNLGVVGGKDGVSKCAEGAVRGVTRTDGVKAVV